jgi:hypothetical protein
MTLISTFLHRFIVSEIIIKIKASVFIEKCLFYYIYVLSKIESYPIAKLHG